MHHNRLGNGGVVDAIQISGLSLTAHLKGQGSWLPSKPKAKPHRSRPSRCCGAFYNIVNFSILELHKTWMPCLRSTNSHLASRFTILKNDETERCSSSSYFSHWELADTKPPRPREERERPQQHEATWCGHASSRKRRIVQISTFFAAVCILVQILLCQVLFVGGGSPQPRHRRQLLWTSTMPSSISRPRQSLPPP